MRRLGVLVLMTVSACGEKVAPKEDSCPASAAALCTATAEVKDRARTALRDINNRNAQGLRNLATRDAIKGDLELLIADVDAGRVTRARASLARLQTTLTNGMAATAGDAPDLVGSALSLLPASELLK